MYIKKGLLFPAIVVILAAVLGITYWFLRPSGSTFPSRIQKPVECDLLIKNGVIVDGSGAEPYQGDIAVAGDKIAAVGKFSARAKETIDAKGLVVTPGFINPHSHIDQTILTNPEAEASLMQGVTTEIVGLDGLSVIDFDAHFRKVAEKGTGVNYGAFAGQGSIRQALMGNSTRQASPREIAAMEALVTKAMEQGAFGLSTGLEYIPGVYTPGAEIIELAKAVAPYQGVYVSHIRNEKDNVVDAVKEALEIGWRAGVPAVISHIKVGSSVYDASREKVIDRNTSTVIHLIDSFRKEGGRAYADIYPYTVPWFQINKRPEQVAGRYPGSLLLVSASTNRSYIGKTVEEIAAEEGVPAGTITQELVGDPLALVCVQTLSENSMQRLLKAPFTAIGMDNNIYWGDPASIPPQHPRLYGTYPRVLGKYVRDNSLLTLAEAVHKMTGMTAQIYGIDKRGTIKEGNYADLVVFDPKTIKDRATYWSPQLTPEGISYVLVNGQAAVAGGKYVYKQNGKAAGEGLRAGRILRHRVP